MIALRDARVVVVGDHPDADAAAALAAARGGHVTRVADARGALTALPGHDVLVVDEWTAEHAPHVVAARRLGLRTTVLAELILDGCSLPVAAVTGTAGKTTASRLLAAILTAAGTSVAITPRGRAGNAWPDASLAATPWPDGGVMVAELTSTHLCHMPSWGGPRVAVVTALWTDHVDLHGSPAAYVAAKRRVLTGAGWAVLPADPGPRALLGPAGRRDIAEFSLDGPVPRGVWRDRHGGLEARWDAFAGPLAADADLPPWAHPAAVAAAACAALALGVPVTAVAAGLRAAAALPHRRAHVGQVRGCPVVDDAMAATPRKATETLRGHPDRSLVLISGGVAAPGGVPVHAHPDEGRLLAEAGREARRAARLIVTFGTAGARVASAVGAAPEAARDLRSAVGRAVAALRPGDTLMLCPMFPMDQADRDAFAGLVRDAATPG